MRERGFSLIEVMVALIVIAVGLLGIGKMQALAIASTTSASMRSLAAIEAASLAGSMHANRDYWDATPPVTTTVTGTTITSTTAGFPAAGSDCTDGDVGATLPCSTTALASYDLEQWALALNQLLPNATATINCPNQTAPLSCTIQISWSEKAVAINSTEAANVATTEQFDTPTYTLYVEP
jgi:type IV pilus assembly protein PilV